MWDVAYAVYRFAPLHAPGNPDSYGSVAEQGRRAARFCRAYGVPADAALPGMVTDRLRDLMEFMRDQAAQGNEAFQSHIKDGHLSLYQADPLYRRQPRGPCQGLWRGVTVSRGLLLTSWYPPSPGGTETYARRLFTHSPAYGWTTTRPRPHPANRPRRPWYDFHSDQHHPGSA
jgi:hypothetical protein